MTGHLARAHAELLRRYHEADGGEDWRERSILGPLVDVADSVRRVGDNPEAHYRADKAGDLLNAALCLQQQTLLAYAAWPEGEAADAICEPYDLIRAVVAGVASATWATASGSGRTRLTSKDSSDLTAAVRQLERWVSGVAWSSTGHGSASAG